MNDNDVKRAEAEAVKENAADTAAEAGRSSEEAACDEAMDRLNDVSPEVARLEAEKADLTDRLLRLAADMENLRKRSERELAEARKYAVAKFAGDMLVVGDNLRRALDAVPPEQRQNDDGALKALLDGVEVTEREMDRLLERNGVRRIAAKGERFDPNRHQAMFEAPDASVPPGTVVQVVQEGYTIGDRTLRAAMVGVSKGGPQPGEAEPAETEADA